MSAQVLMNDGEDFAAKRAQMEREVAVYIFERDDVVEVETDGL